MSAWQALRRLLLVPCGAVFTADVGIVGKKPRSIGGENATASGILSGPRPALKLQRKQNKHIYLPVRAVPPSATRCVFFVHS